MVLVPAPPPSRPPRPIFHTLKAGTRLVRLFDPSRHKATALSFRSFGPLYRFDHHTPADSQPGIDPKRGIYYAGRTLSSCIVEIFGDTGIVHAGNWHIASPYAHRDLRLLDLRNNGAMRAGSVAALAKVPDHALAQSWSRHFYDGKDYQACDGLIYFNAHNDEEAIALYERAEEALTCPAASVMRLDHDILKYEILRVADEHGLLYSLPETRTARGH